MVVIGNNWMTDFVNKASSSMKNFILIHLYFLDSANLILTIFVECSRYNGILWLRLALHVIKLAKHNM